MKYLFLLGLFLSAFNTFSEECYDSVSLNKVICSIDKECLSSKEIGEIYNLVAMSEPFFLAGMDYNTVKEGLSADFSAYNKNFADMNSVKRIMYRCVRRGGKDFLIVGGDGEGSNIVLNYTFRDGGVVAGGRANEKDLSRFLLKHSWIVIDKGV